MFSLGFTEESQVSALGILVSGHLVLSWFVFLESNFYSSPSRVTLSHVSHVPDTWGEPPQTLRHCRGLGLYLKPGVKFPSLSDSEIKFGIADPKCEVSTGAALVAS